MKKGRLGTGPAPLVAEKSIFITWINNAPLYVIFLLFICALVFGAASLVAYVSYRDAVHYTNNLNSSTADLLARLVLQHEQRLFDLAETYASRPFLVNAVKKRDFKGLDEELMQIRQRYDVNTVFVTDLTGTVLATSPPRPYVGTSLAEADLYKEVMANYNSYLSPAFHKQEDERDLITAVAAPMIDEKGRIVGILALSERVELFESIMKGLMIEPGTKVSLVDQKGHIVYSNSGFRSDTLVEHPLARYVNGAEEGLLDLKHKETLTMVFSYVPIPQLRWAVFLQRGKRDILQGMFPTFLKIAAVSSLFFIVITLLLDYLRNISLSRQRVEAERNRLVTAVEQAADGISIVNRKGVIDYVNPSYSKMTGYSREELEGASLEMLRGTRHGPEFYRAMWATVADGNVWSGRIDTRRKNGTSFDAQVTISPVTSKERQIAGYVCLTRDISAEVRAEKQLRQTQKMEAVGTLASGIAHDFNNILAAIVGFSELALEDMPDSASEKRFIRNVYQAGIRGRDLVKQILAFSRKTEQEHKAILLPSIIKETLKLLRASIAANIEIRQEFAAGNETVLADPVQIQQMIMNLCANAAQAMREQGGVLEVELSDFNVEKEWNNPELKPGSYFRITVKDNGPGIPPEIIDRIFDPFFTTKTQGEGTGLGLAVVHTIVENLRGNITVTSSLGNGTRFDIYLPKMAVVPLKQEEAKEQEKEGKQERILFVDDEPSITEMGKQIIERMGYRVVTETDSVKALKRFEEQPDAFDLVITDQTMPVVTGVELSRRLLSIRPDLPIILCTGYSEVVSPQKAREIGIKEFLSKPIVKADLAATIRRVLDGK